MKPLQAIALAEKSIDLSAHKKLTPAEYSLICASHNGQRLHVDAARHLLAKFDLSPELLVCGAHWSSDEPTAIDQIRSLEVPATIHNNCSGKHLACWCLRSSVHRHQMAMQRFPIPCSNPFSVHLRP